MSKSDWEWFDELSWPWQIMLVILCLPFILFILIWAVFMDMITTETLNPKKPSSTYTKSNDTHDHN